MDKMDENRKINRIYQLGWTIKMDIIHKVNMDKNHKIDINPK